MHHAGARIRTLPSPDAVALGMEVLRAQNIGYSAQATLPMKNKRDISPPKTPMFEYFVGSAAVATNAFHAFFSEVRTAGLILRAFKSAACSSDRDMAATAAAEFHVLHAR
jgi:hypothetical protein